jgi:hypothetical protein
LWTGDGEAVGDLVAAWNELADFTTLMPTSRRGVTIIGASDASALGAYSAAPPLVGRLRHGASDASALGTYSAASPLVGRVRRGAIGRALSMVDPEVGRGSLEVVTEDVTAYGIRLPLPPKRMVPKAMTIDASTRLSFRFDIYTDRDVVSFTCGLGPDDPKQRQAPMPASCGTTTPVHLAPASIIAGEVTRMELIGIFSAYRITIDEAAP